MVVSGITGWDTLSMELLDPVGDGNDGLDPGNQPAYVPSGYSTSNNEDGLSFAQETALEPEREFRRRLSKSDRRRDDEWQRSPDVRRPWRREWLA